MPMTQQPSNPGDTIVERLRAEIAAQERSSGIGFNPCMVIREVLEQAVAEIERLRRSGGERAAVVEEPTDAMLIAMLQAGLDWMAECGVTGLSPFSDYPSPTETCRRMWRAGVRSLSRRGAAELEGEQP